MNRRLRMPDLLTAPGEWIAANWVAITLALLALVVGWMVAGFVFRLIGNRLPQRVSASRNLAPLLAQAARYAIIIFAIITALSLVGVPSASLIGILAAGGLAIALALQNT